MDTVYNQLVDEFNLIVYYDLKGEEQNRLRRKAVLELKDDISIQKTELAQLKISIWTTDAELSAKLVNRLVEITRFKEESIWKSGYEKMLLNFNKSIDSLSNIYEGIGFKAKLGKEHISPLDLVKSNTLSEQINTQQKAVAEIKLAIDNNPPALYVLETATPAAKPEKPNVLEVLILSTMVSVVFGTMALLIYNRKDSL